MKKNLIYFLIPVIILAGWQCAVYTDVHSDYDKSADFTKYRTFAWLPDSGMTARTDSFRNTAYDNDIIRNNVKNYVNQHLNERGLRIQVDKPDLLMHLVLLNEKKQRIVTYPVLYYPFSSYPIRHYPYFYRDHLYYPYYYPYYDVYTFYGWGCNPDYCNDSPAHKQTYVKGTIILTMYDRKLKKVIWTSSAEGDIYDPSYIEKDIHPAVRRIMKTFPVKVIAEKPERLFSEGKN